MMKLLITSKLNMMKTKITIITIAIVALGVATYAGLQYAKNKLYKHTEISVFVDVTDIQKNPITAQEITNLADMEHHRWWSYAVRLQTLSNYKYTSIGKVELPDAFMAFSNPKKRKKQIALFNENLKRELNSLYRPNTTKPHSALYDPIIREANRLSHFKGKRFIIIHSDLQEHSELFSIYRKADYVLLQKNPEQVMKRLTDSLQPEDLKGIDFYFIYEPKDESDNKRFLVMVHVFQKILESHNATVHIGANIVKP